MTGIKYLLDTNFLIGLLKASPDVIAVVLARQIQVSECAYSFMTRMEILGFEGLEQDECLLIESKLFHLTRLELSIAIEEKVIEIRRSRKVKMPDAIIAATTLVHKLELLTLDLRLDSLWRSLGGRS
jgi:predicted nucleic acid-binding protein